MNSEEKILPVERALLGLVLTNVNALGETYALIKVKYLTKGIHQLLFQSIRDLYETGKPVDIFILIQYLKTEEILEQSGGESYLRSLVDQAGDFSDIQYYFKQITNSTYSTYLKIISKKIEDLSSKDRSESKGELEILINDLNELLQNDNPDSTRSIKDLFGSSEISFKNIVEKKIYTHFVCLDSLFDGFKFGEFVVIGGRPSMGKSAFILSIALNNAKKEIPSAFFSFELTSNRITHRLLSMELDIPISSITNNQLDDFQIELIKNKEKEHSSLPLYIIDNPPNNIQNLMDAIRHHAIYHNTKLIFIDYLQFLRIYGHQGSREIEMSKISRQLKTLSKELNILIMAACQLNRSVENRLIDQYIPKLSDLRDSGALEQDTDKVIFLVRPEVYNLTEDEMGRPTKGIVRVVLAKNRTGRTGTSSIAFKPDYTKFFDLGGSKFDTSFLQMFEELEFDKYKSGELQE